MKRLKYIRLITCVMTLFVFASPATAQKAKIIITCNRFPDNAKMVIYKETPYYFLNIQDPITLTSSDDSGTRYEAEIDVSEEGDFFKLFSTMTIYAKPGTTIKIDYDKRDYARSKFEGALALENQWLNSVLLNHPFILNAERKIVGYENIEQYSFHLDSCYKNLKKSLADIHTSVFFSRNMDMRIELLRTSSLLNAYVRYDHGEKSKKMLNDALNILKKYDEPNVLKCQQGFGLIQITNQLDSSSLPSVNYKRSPEFLGFLSFVGNKKNMLTEVFRNFSLKLQDSVLQLTAKQFITENDYAFPGNDLMDAELIAADGRKVKLSDFKGAVIYLDFWATWCKPCIALKPHFIALSQQFDTPSIKFLAISTDKSYDVWKQDIESHKDSGNVEEYWLADRDFLTHYKINSIPRMMLVNKDFKINASDAIRPSSENLIQLKEHLTQILKK